MPTFAPILGIEGVYVLSTTIDSSIYYRGRRNSSQFSLVLGRWYAEPKRRRAMPQPQTVTLTEEERSTLETFVHRGKANARTLTRARILLKSAEGWSTAELAATFDVCEATVTNVRRRFADGGLEAVLHDKVQQHRRSALSGLQTAHLIAVACSPSPDGHDHWTVRLLAQKAFDLGFVTNISPTTIHDLLKKTN